MLAQIKDFDPEKCVTAHEMEPLHFLSGSFKEAQLNWATPDKEVYAIIESVNRLRYLLFRPKNLEYTLIIETYVLCTMHGAQRS